MTTSHEIPLGQAESQRLEFKAAAALERLERIGREVVGMLNSEGGEVWIGLREEASRAVQIERIVDPEREAKRLVDYLVDSLLPPVSTQEVTVEVVPVPAGRSPDEASGGGLIRVLVKPEPGKVRYALSSSKGWLFVRRVQERLRPMTWPEVFGAVKRGDQVAEDSFARVLDERRRAQEDAHPRLWITIQPSDDLKLDFSDELFYAELEALLEDPSRTGNRRGGWHFARTAQQPEPRSGRITWGHRIPQQDIRQLVVITDSGGLTCEVSLRRLAHKAPGELSPVPLFEYPASAFRLAAAIYRERTSGTRPVTADLALFGVRDWKLRPGGMVEAIAAGGAPVSFWSTDEAVAYHDADDFLTDHPLIFPAEEVIGRPDACAFRLLTLVYLAFGLRPDTILPGLYDRAAGRLVLEE